MVNFDSDVCHLCGLGSMWFGSVGSIMRVVWSILCRGFLTGSPGYCGGRILDVVSFSGLRSMLSWFGFGFFISLVDKSVFSACSDLTMMYFSNVMV